MRTIEASSPSQAPSAPDELDRRLHAERGRLHERELKELPDCAFVVLDGEP